jgi:threonyl-tRNA synthetase
MPYELKPGDGAFYGPKIDFDVTDSIGRAWQLGTIQLDYMNPERFDMTYVGEDNAPHRPVVIHRAVSGSFERFIAILIEHFAGNFPTWLAPEQVRVIPIAADYDAYAAEVAAAPRRGAPPYDAIAVGGRAQVPAACRGGRGGRGGRGHCARAPRRRTSPAPASPAARRGDRPPTPPPTGPRPRG